MRSSSKRLELALAGALLGPSLFGCTCAGDAQRDHTAPGPTASSSSDTPAPAAPADPARRQVALLGEAQKCQFDHRGLLLDWSDDGTLGQQRFRLGSELKLERVERGGVQFRLLEQLSTVLDFWWTRATPKLEITALVQARQSERVSFSIDGRLVGTVKLKPGETQEVHLALRDFALTPGRHEISVSLPRSRKSAPALELAWLRLGTEARLDKMDQPMARRDALSEVTINGQRRHSIILREGSGFRCPQWLPGPGRRLMGQVGLWGQGAGEGEIVAVLEDGSEKILETVRIASEDARAWLPIDVDLSEFSERFVSLEWRAPRLSRGARLAFAEPTLVEPPLELKAAPPARRVLLVVLAGISADHGPPHASERGLPALQQLATEATHFPGYRTNTTSSQAVLASLLSGTSPWQHGLGEQDSVWPKDVPHLAELIEAAGGRTSFFTGVPESFSAFGFDQGFEAFEQISPVLDVSATEPIKRARTWLEAQLTRPAPVLSVLHLRGGHPPFDISQEAALELPPPEYGGDLDARRAAIQLLAVRSRTRLANRQMPDEDWTRLDALRKKALLDQSLALTALFNKLRETNTWDDSLIILMGDVSSGARPQIPFDERAPLEERNLSVPLYVKFPGKHLAGRPVSGLFSPRDVFATVAQALGRAAPVGSIPLGSSAAESSARERAHVAYRGGFYSTRLGPYLLLGQDGHAPHLCRVDLDPSCSLDRSAQEPLPLRLLWLETFSALHDSLLQQKAEPPLVADEALNAALTVWGVRR